MSTSQEANDRIHESIEVAKLDAAKFIIGQFTGVVKDEKKPPVYDAAVKYIENALTEKG